MIDINPASKLTLVVFGTLLGSGMSRADYEVALMDSRGENTLEVSPGEIVDLDLHLFGDAGDQHDAHVIWLVVDRAGLQYLDYQWASTVFVRGGDNDFSRPSAGELDAGPIVINPDTVLNPLAPSDSDFELQALTEIDGTFFSVGTLATLTFGVPDGYGSGQVTISVASAEFTDAGVPVNALPGEPFTLVVHGSEPQADSDGDGVTDDADAFPDDPAETTDTDGDGTGDSADSDDDNDGTDDTQDDFPVDPAETTDTDDDGTGDNADPDDDNDGVDDVDDTFPFDPMAPTPTPARASVVAESAVSGWWEAAFSCYWGSPR